MAFISPEKKKTLMGFYVEVEVDHLLPAKPDCAEQWGLFFSSLRSAFHALEVLTRDNPPEALYQTAEKKAGKIIKQLTMTHHEGKPLPRPYEIKFKD